MPALSAAELAAMRDVIETELLPDTCTLLTLTSTANGMGGQTQSWGTASSNVPCRLDMTRGREQVSGEAWRPFTMYTLSLPYDTTITTAYRVVHSSVTYAVTSVNTNQSWIAVKRCELEKV